jgi:hypothetical protein
MKRFLILASLIPFMGACTKAGDGGMSDNSSFNLTASLAAFDATGGSSSLAPVWPAEATVGIFEFDETASIFTNSNRPFKLSEGAGTATGKFAGSSQLSEGWVVGAKTFYGYYPYNATQNMASSISFSIPAEQTQMADDPTAHITASNFLTVTASLAKGNETEASVTFESATAALRFDITNSTTAPLTIDYLLLSSNGGIFYKSGTYNLRTGSATFTDSDKSPAVKLTPENPVTLAVGESHTFNMLIYPMNIPMGGDISLEIFADREQSGMITQKATQADIDLEAGVLYSTAVNLTNAAFDRVVTVTLPANQNSFMIAPSSSGLDSYYLLPVDRVNEFWASADESKTLGNTDAWVADIIWQDFDISGTAQVLSFTEGMNRGTGTISKIGLTLKTYPADQYGNALIGIRKADGGGNPTGDYLWSWHVWITDFDAEQDAVNYGGTNSTISMDRNLGAKNTTKGDAGSFGLLYQWGRKDPFIGAATTTGTTKAATTLSSWPAAVETSVGGSIPYSVQHPTTFVAASMVEPFGDWLADGIPASSAESIWRNQSQGSKKIYDPCPQGWRVASRNAWSAFAAGTTFVYDADNHGYTFNGTDWYPMAGRLNHHTGELENTGTAGYYFSSGSATRTGSFTDPAGLNHVARSLYFTGETLIVDDNNNARRSNGTSIRCVQDTTDN